MASGAIQNSAACWVGEPSRFSNTTMSTNMTTDMDTGSPVKNRSHPAPVASVAAFAPV